MLACLVAVLVYVYVLEGGDVLDCAGAVGFEIGHFFAAGGDAVLALVV